MNEVKTVVTISDQSLKEFLSVLKNDFQLDYSGYSESFVSRRLLNLMEVQKINSPGALLLLFRQQPETLSLFERALSINYTEMFRDPGFFYSLRRNVFPFLATYPTLKIWNAGCSTGEEVFSMAILLHEVGLLRRTKIYATDKEKSVLDQAATSIFDASRMKEYTANYYDAGGKGQFSNYYSSAYGQFKFQSELRKSIVFKKHNLVTDKPFEMFNLVLCRNVMIYFGMDLQDIVVSKLKSSLSNLGYLGLGATETLSFNKHRHEFASIDKAERIYRKVSLSEWRNCKN